MIQISQVLTCDTQEEAEEICMLPAAGRGKSKSRDEFSHDNLNLQEIRGLYSLRVDLNWKPLFSKTEYLHLIIYTKK